MGIGNTINVRVKVNYNRVMNYDAYALDILINYMYIITYIYGVISMDAITYTTARANLADTMNRVCEDHEPIIITRNSEQAVVMIALDDFNALEETSYLLRSPKNARRLLESISRLETGQGIERDLMK